MNLKVKIYPKIRLEIEITHKSPTVITLINQNRVLTMLCMNPNPLIDL